MQVVVAVSISFFALQSARSAELTCQYPVLPEEWEQTVQAAFAEGRLDDLVAVYRRRIRTNDPRVFYGLGLFIGLGGGEFPTVRDRNITALMLTKRSALCGYHNALLLLSEAYGKGVFGVAVDEERSNCLEAMYRSSEFASAIRCGVSLTENDVLANPNWTATQANEGH
jgi:hypothetical protein